MVEPAHLPHDDYARDGRVNGGVVLFRGAGTAARRYLEADRSQSCKVAAGEAMISVDGDAVDSPSARCRR